MRENTFFSDTVLCTNIIHESRYNRSRKQYIFFSDRIVNHVSPNHTVARAYNCPENFILRLYLPFSIEKHASIILEPEGIKKEKKKKKKHTIMKIIMKSSLLTVLNASSSRFQALKGTGMLVYWNLWSHRKRAITHIFAINAKPRLVSVARHLV